MNRRLLGAFAASVWLFVGHPGAAQTHGSEPLRVSGEWRARYETLSGQFRAGGSGGDQMFALRTLVLAEFDAGPIT